MEKKKEERKKEKLREWNATMPNCSAYQREQKGEITLLIAGWALIKQTGSGSCLLQHLSNRKHYKSLKRLPCPSSAQESCSQDKSWLSSPSTQPLQVPLPSCKEGETSLPYPESKPEELLLYRTAWPQEKVKHYFVLFTPHLLPLSVCDLEMLLNSIFSTALMLPGLETYHPMRPQTGGLCLHRWQQQWSLQYKWSSNFHLGSKLLSPVYAPALAWMNLETDNLW